MTKTSLIALLSAAGAAWADIPSVPRFEDRTPPPQPTDSMMAWAGASIIVALLLSFYGLWRIRKRLAAEAAARQAGGPEAP